VKVTWDTGPVLTLKLVWSARHITALCLALITSIWAVSVSITNPGQMDACDAVFTLKFTWQTVRWTHGTLWTTLQKQQSI